MSVPGQMNSITQSHLFSQNQDQTWSICMKCTGWRPLFVVEKRDSPDRGRENAGDELAHIYRRDILRKWSQEKEEGSRTEGSHLPAIPFPPVTGTWR